MISSDWNFLRPRDAEAEESVRRGWRDVGDGDVDDDGAADRALARVLERWEVGEADETDVVAALADTRLFVPVFAEVSHAEITEDGLVADKEADILKV